MGDVIRFARPTDDAPLPKPPQPMKPPPGVSPHTHFATLIALWMVGAEIFCGLDWSIRVAEKALKDLKDRRIYNDGNPKR